MIPQFEIFESIEVPGSVWAHVSCHKDTRCPCAHDVTHTDCLFFFGPPRRLYIDQALWRYPGREFVQRRVYIHLHAQDGG
jgi:hypothetical protein